MANVKVLRETSRKHGGASLCFQWCRYIYGQDRPDEHGYRFMWRRADGSLQAARGQARIPSIAEALDLIETARSEGWGDFQGE